MAQKFRGEDKTSVINNNMRRGRENILRVDNASWWKWSGSSTLFSWR